MPVMLKTDIDDAGDFQKQKNQSETGESAITS